MAYTTQYIGSRYVPKFADPAEWNNKRTYEPLTIVLNEGNSYTSRQFVPVGIDISNDDYWAETGNYNAQVEAYRKEVQVLDGRVTANANSIAAVRKTYVRVFDTVADMKAANLVAGMVCHTNGFHAIDDNGAGLYLITTEGEANEMDTISCSNLFAKLIIGETVTPEMLGAYGNGTEDDTEPVKRSFEIGSNVVCSGTYSVSEITSDIEKSLYINGGKFTLRSYSTEGNFSNNIKFTGSGKIKLTNCTFDGNNLVTISTRIINGLYIDANLDADIENCTFVNCCGNGLYVNIDTSMCKVSNSIFTANQIHGISSACGNSLVVDNCIFKNNGGQALDIAVPVPSKKYADVKQLGYRPIALISNCLIDGNGTGNNETGQPYSSGMKIYAHTEATVKNCVFRNNGHATHIGQQLRIGNFNYYDSNNFSINNGSVRVSNCQFEGTKTNISPINNCEPCESLTIEGCVFSGSFNSNFITSPGIISNNEFDNADKKTVLQLWCSNMTISSNRFKFTGAPAVYAKPNATVPSGVTMSNISVTDNYFDGDYTYGDAIIGADNSMIAGNVCKFDNAMLLIDKASHNSVIGYNKVNIMRNSGSDTSLSYLPSGVALVRDNLLFNGTVIDGTIVYNTTESALQMRKGNVWVNVTTQ